MRLAQRDQKKPALNNAANIGNFEIALSGPYPVERPDHFLALVILLTLAVLCLSAAALLRIFIIA